MTWICVHSFVATRFKLLLLNQIYHIGQSFISATITTNVCVYYLKAKNKFNVLSQVEPDSQRAEKQNRAL